MSDSSVARHHSQASEEAQGERLDVVHVVADNAVDNVVDDGGEEGGEADGVAEHEAGSRAEGRQLGVDMLVDMPVDTLDMLVDRLAVDSLVVDSEQLALGVEHMDLSVGRMDLSVEHTDHGVVERMDQRVAVHMGLEHMQHMDFLVVGRMDLVVAHIEVAGRPPFQVDNPVVDKPVDNLLVGTLGVEARSAEDTSSKIVKNEHNSTNQKSEKTVEMVWAAYQR